MAAENGILCPTEALRPLIYGELSSPVHYAVDLDPTYFVNTAKHLSCTQVLSNVKNKVRYPKNLAAKCKGPAAPKEFTLKPLLG